MDSSLPNVDLNENPYAGTEQVASRLRHREDHGSPRNRSKPRPDCLGHAQAVGPSGFHSEIRKAVQACIKFDV